MRFIDARKLKQGVPVYTNKVKVPGNYLIDKVWVDIFNSIVRVQLDDGTVLSHKQIHHAIVCGNIPFYCSWYGITLDIAKTGLAAWQLQAIGVKGG